MGMFDWFQPADEWLCPKCGELLSGWQGKEGPCFGFVWQQGMPAPVGFALDGLEFMEPPGDDDGTRLPLNFSIYTRDTNRHWVTLACRSTDGVWSEARLTGAEDPTPV